MRKQVTSEGGDANDQSHLAFALGKALEDRGEFDESIKFYKRGNAIRRIEHRHSLKMVIQSTIVTTVIMTATGDANGLADMGIGLGALLLSANYSRDYETEADLFAFEKMLELGIDPIAFSNMMQRMTDYSEELMGSGEKKGEVEKQQ